ncbi:MAG: ABC transporter permease [Dehalococcoidales bacterium]|nr:ABC transporter permease [Dehalococcoidales bacterium]
MQMRDEGAAAPGSPLRGEPVPYWRWLLGRVLQVRLATVALTLITCVACMAVFAPWISPARPTDVDLTAVLRGPSLKNLMGTDELGRDIFSRVIDGSRASLSAGLISAAIGLTVGTFFGLLAGYFLGLVDMLIMRLVDAMLAFPGIILALAITAALGPSLTNAMIAIGIVSIPTFARLARAQVLTICRLDYVEAARCLGAPNRHIIIRHVVPNMLTPIIVQSSLAVAFAILTEATLSFLGLGVQPPTPSWGYMLNVGRGYLSQAPWMSLFPGIAIFLTVMSINLLGDALRDALDPRLRIE